MASLSPIAAASLLPGDEELIYKALVLGLRDYLHNAASNPPCSA